MVLIPAGSFVMEDTFGEGADDELPLHTNYVSAFYMNTNLVSYALWQQVIVGRLRTLRVRGRSSQNFCVFAPLRLGVDLTAFFRFNALRSAATASAL